MQHPTNYQQLSQAPPPKQFVQYSQPHNYLQHSSQKKQNQQINLYPKRREDGDGSNRYFTRQMPQRQHQPDQQKATLKDPNSFVPLQALKKHRNAKKSEYSAHQERQEHSAEGKFSVSNSQLQKEVNPSQTQGKVCFCFCFHLLLNNVYKFCSFISRIKFFY